MNVKLTERSPVLETRREEIHGIRNFLTFDDGDDDLSFKVSILSDSAEPDYELVADVIGVLRAYGFTEIQESVQAPGSWFGRIKAVFQNQHKTEARRNKAELHKDLKSDRLPHSPQKRKAVGKLKNGFKGLKKRVKVVIIMGATMLGDAAYDATKDTVKEWMKQEIPKVEQKMKEEAAKAQSKIRGYFVVDVLPQDAQKLHDAVNGKIEKSPQKQTIPVPPPG